MTALSALPSLSRLLAVVLALILTIVTGAQICRSQDAAPPANQDSRNTNSEKPNPEKPGPEKPSPERKDRQSKRDDSSTQPQGTERMFGVMPAYGLIEAGLKPPPLTSGQKFKLAVQYLNPYTFLFVAAEAGINQARNDPSEYGQGAEGYGKRYGAGFADGLTDGIFVTGVYPSLLHQDPRYYRLGDGGFSHRFGYSATRILVTRQDSGRRAFNISEILGAFTSSAIGVTYYPKSQRDFSDVAERAGIQFGFDAGFNVLKEFYPDIQRKLFGKHKR
jgi:hypothetical protein